MQSTWKDPPEYREGGGGGGPQIALPTMTWATKRLLWINGIVFLFFFVAVDWSVARRVYEVLALQPDMWREWFPFVPVWQLLSYGFLHSTSDVLHLLFNLLALYFFGTLVEGIVGARSFLATYLVAIVLGGAVQLTASLAVGDMTATVGASGGVVCILVAAAVMRPNMVVIFILFPLKLRTLALIMVGLDVLRLIRGGGGVAYWVHLSGAAWGFLSVKQRWIWVDPLAAWEARRVQREAEGERDDAQRLDSLLDRIHHDGIHTLSRSERAFLKRVSGRK